VTSTNGATVNPVASAAPGVTVTGPPPPDTVGSGEDATAVAADAPTDTSTVASTLIAGGTPPSRNEPSVGPNAGNVIFGVSANDTAGPGVTVTGGGGSTKSGPTVCDTRVR
jgi:hypothetical protein